MSHSEDSSKIVINTRICLDNALMPATYLGDIRRHALLPLPLLYLESQTVPVI